jgi:tetratricopeptide (TPR) repeat protein
MNIESIEPPDSHHLRAAEGWIELGNYVQAVEELKKISLQCRFHPLVLLTHWEIHALANQWAFAHIIAHALIVLFPKEPVGWINASYALHQMKRTDEAWTTLLPAAEIFPTHTVIAYNLACYSCQMGKTDEARRWLEKAIALGDSEAIRSAARKDPDLQPLWG